MGGWFHSADECNPQDSYTICSQASSYMDIKCLNCYTTVYYTLVNSDHWGPLTKWHKVCESEKGTSGSLSKGLKPFLHLLVNLKMKKHDKKLQGWALCHRVKALKAKGN